jgi:hypothetical protein
MFCYFDCRRVVLRADLLFLRKNKFQICVLLVAGVSIVLEARNRFIPEKLHQMKLVLQFFCFNEVT